MLKNIDFEPLFDFVLIEPIKHDMTAGGLALPDIAQIGPPKGIVIKVGPGRVIEDGKFLPTNTKSGQIVYLAFAYSKPMEIEFNGTKYIVCRERDLIGISKYNKNNNN